MGFFGIALHGRMGFSFFLDSALARVAFDTYLLGRRSDLLLRCLFFALRYILHSAPENGVPLAPFVLCSYFFFFFLGRAIDSFGCVPCRTCCFLPCVCGGSSRAFLTFRARDGARRQARVGTGVGRCDVCVRTRCGLEGESATLEVASYGGNIIDGRVLGHCCCGVRRDVRFAWVIVVCVVTHASGTVTSTQAVQGD